MTSSIIIIGASGHAAVVAQAAAASGYRVIAFLADSPSEIGIPVAGLIVDFPKVLAANPGSHVHIAIGDNHVRQKVVEKVKSLVPGLIFAAVIHPSAVVCEEGSVGAGAFVAASSIVGVGAKVSDFAILNTRASLDHHSTLSAYASMAPASATGGNTHIGEGAHIGMGAMIHHGIKIGAHAILGSLALANKDVPTKEIWVGNPARFLKCRQLGETYL